MQYYLVKPLLTYTMHQLKMFVISKRNNLVNSLAIFCILTISLVTVMTFYLVRFPLTEMDEKVLFTKDLISIIPSDKEKEPNTTLAILTTETLEFKEYSD